MLPRPPTSTLFPYTTLFRSSAARMPGCSSTIAESALVSMITPNPLRQSFRTPHQSASGFAHFRRADNATLLSSSDRKSTRLNSSHPSISYAVFCLKKKKTHTTQLLSLFNAPATTDIYTLSLHDALPI